MEIDCEFIEEIILGMADIVLENRILRKQNAELKDYQQKYDNELMKNYKNSQTNAATMLQLALAIGEKERSL